MTTLQDLAQETGMEVYGLAAFLDLGRDYDETAEISADDERIYREALDIAKENALDYDDLALAAHQVTEAEAARSDAITARNELIREASEAGVRVADITRRTGLTRAMVYSILDGERRRS